MLLAAEHIAPAAMGATAPDAIDRWLVRDLVETAWAMASRRQSPERAEWAEPARRALERLAWRLLEPAGARTARMQEISEPRLTSREG
jgi:hypothetical protein